MRQSAEGHRKRDVDLGSLFAAAFTLIGAGIGASRVSDNSFLTHLATGRRMVDEGFVRSDAFTWTSAGEPVVVQSWLASGIYGVVDATAGLGGLRLLMAATVAALAFLAWQLSERSTSVAVRVCSVGVVVWIGTVTWTQRPLLLGLIALALTLVWVERARDPRGLFLVGVLWIGVHGSWPLGLVLLTVRAFGAAADSYEADRELRAALAASKTRAEVKAGLWLGGGMVFGGLINPYGPRLLIFPLKLLSRGEVLAYISEWKASGFDSLWSQLFLVLIALALVAARRAPMVTIAPAVVFVVAALLSARNISVASLVLLPLLAAGLPQLAARSVSYRSSAVTLAVRGLAVLVVLVPLVAVRGPHVDLERYPEAAIDAMETELGLDPRTARVVHPDFVGNYLAARYGPTEAAWIDDRFELHDPALVEDFVSLLFGHDDWAEALARQDADALLWAHDRVLVDLVESIGWSPVWSDDDWVVLVPPA